MKKKKLSFKYHKLFTTINDGRTEERWGAKGLEVGRKPPTPTPSHSRDHSDLGGVRPGGTNCSLAVKKDWTGQEVVIIIIVVVIVIIIVVVVCPDHMTSAGG